MFSKRSQSPASARLHARQLATRLFSAGLFSAGLFSAGLFIAGLFGASQLLANDAMIVDAKIQAAGDRKFQIHVTLEHADTGWDHYANRWDVLDQNGKLLGSRTLHHPHVNEQPFTRSLTLTIPSGVTRVTIVASDSVHGDNDETFELEVPQS